MFSNGSGCFDWWPIKGSLLFSASVKRWLTHSLRVKVIYPLLLQTLLKAAWLQSGLPAWSVKPISSFRLTWKRRQYIIGRLFLTTSFLKKRCMKSGHLMFGHTFRCDRNGKSFGAAHNAHSPVKYASAHTETGNNVTLLIRTSQNTASWQPCRESVIGASFVLLFIMNFET